MPTPAPADQTLYELRTYCESCSKEYDVPMERIIDFAASIGGAELYCSRGDVLGPHEFRDKVLAFCRTEMLSRLPPDQRDAISNAAQRNNHVDWREWRASRAEPLMKSHGVLRADFDATIVRALHVGSVTFLHKYSGGSDDATKDLIKYLEQEGRTVRMTPKKRSSEEKLTHDNERRDALSAVIKPNQVELGIADKPFDCQRMYMAAWKMSWMDAVASDIPIEDLLEWWRVQYEAKKAGKELDDHLGRPPAGNGLDLGRQVQVNGAKLEEPSVAPAVAEQTDLFNQDLAEAAEKLKSLPDAPDLTEVKPPPANEEGQGEAKDTPAAIPTPETPVAPAGEPAPPAQSASESPLADAPIEPERLFVKEEREFADLELFYTLEAKWDKADADAWFATAVTKRRLSDAEEKTLHTEIGRYLEEKHAGEVISDIEYEPTVPEIDDLRKTAQKMISELFPTDSPTQQAEHFKAGTGHEKAADALRIEDKDPVLRRLHAYLMQENERRNTERAETEKALAIRPELPPIPVQPGNVLSFPIQTTFKVPTPADLAFIDWYAEVSIASRMYPSVESAAQAKMVMIRGHFMGIDPAAAMDSIYPIKNNKTGAYAFTVAAPLAKAMVERTKECERFDVFGDKNKATAIIKRKGREEQVFTFTIEDARSRNLTSKWNWTAAPDVMLQYRAMTKGIKIQFPEIYYFFPEIDDEEAA